MTARDVLREKVAEALYEWDVAALNAHQDALGVLRTTLPWETLDDTRRASYLARADAVLDVLATHLTDADVVERAARAVFDHTIQHEAQFDRDGTTITRTYSCSCGQIWDGRDLAVDALHHRVRATLATVLGGEAS